MSGRGHPDRPVASGGRLTRYGESLVAPEYRQRAELEVEPEAALGTERARDDKPRHVLIVEDHELLARSEEHTSELQSLRHLVCRLLLEKKKLTRRRPITRTEQIRRINVTRRQA